MPIIECSLDISNDNISGLKEDFKYFKHEGLSTLIKITHILLQQMALGLILMVVECSWFHIFISSFSPYWRMVRMERMAAIG